MYYLKCKHCNHLNEVKSEYMVVCGLCNRKLEDNYKDWKVRHPEKSFEDFQREVCLTDEQVKRGDMVRNVKRKSNKKGVIAGLIGGLLGILMLVVVINGMKECYDKLCGQDETPLAEQQWYTGTYAGGISLTTPRVMKSAGSMIKRLPEDVQPVVKEMESFTYSGYGVELVYLFTEYTLEVGQVDLEGAATGGLNQLKGQRGVFDLKHDMAYVQEGDMSGVVMQGSFVKGGTEFEFKVTIFVVGMKLYQVISSNKKGDDVARDVVRRVYDSLKVLGHETVKTEEE